MPAADMAAENPAVGATIGHPCARSVPADGAALGPPLQRRLRIQLYSDLHLETETFDPEPMAGAELLILAGDIDATWRGYERFANWPVPMIAVAGNHEFDGREWLVAWPALRELGDRLGIRWLERETFDWTSPATGLRVRWVGATRWSDLDLFGEAGRARAVRAARYFLDLAATSIGGEPLDVPRLRTFGLADRHWLERALAVPTIEANGNCRPHAATHADPTPSHLPDLTVAITHFAPSLRCADPRFGAQPGTASFCNADDDLLPGADLWLHGHLHSRHDFVVAHPATSPRPSTRVVCAARGNARRRETHGYDPHRLIELTVEGQGPCA